MLAVQLRTDTNNGVELILRPAGFRPQGAPNVKGRHIRSGAGDCEQQAEHRGVQGASYTITLHLIPITFYEIGFTIHI